MAYSELIKNFERIRSYMRQFYVYGFKNRNEYPEKSARSYDNERRRIECWLRDYMAFRREESGKQVFLSMDSRAIPRNPLHKAFRAKSFTDKDITFHFYILDLLAEGRELTASAMAEEIDEGYLSRFPEAEPVEISTLRKKLKEYEALGLLRSRKQGKELLYSRETDEIDLRGWEEALRFYAETEPLGVVGSFLLDTLEAEAAPFRFKHHYLLHALDSVVLWQLLEAIREKQMVEVTIWSPVRQKNRIHRVHPKKICISVQNGRQYLMGWHMEGKRMAFFRLDTIHAVKKIPCDTLWEMDDREAEEFRSHLWGVAAGDGKTLHHLEMDILVEPWETFLLQRLQREKRCGTVEMVDGRICRFRADVYDAKEMLPWLRTFLGRIVRLECTDEGVTERFYRDLDAMNAMYGGDQNAVS